MLGDDVRRHVFALIADYAQTGIFLKEEVNFSHFVFRSRLSLQELERLPADCKLVLQLH